MFRTSPLQVRCAHRRNGVMLIIVIVCLLLMTMIGASLLRVSLMQRRQVHREQLQQQTIWLAESGIERAVAQLRTDSDYVGEKWELSGADSIGGKDATVTISVAMTDTEDSRTVSVQAVYPMTGDQRVRISKQIVVEM